MLSDKLTARTIAHLRTRPDKKSRDLAEQIFAQSPEFHPTCHYCELAKPSGVFPDRIYCPKFNATMPFETRKPCFKGTKTYQSRIALLTKN